MRIDSIAYVSGLAHASAPIQAGIALMGTNALLMNTSGRVMKPEIAKNVVWLGTRQARARKIDQFVDAVNLTLRLYKERRMTYRRLMVRKSD
jgi:hypothetical protein